MSYFNTTRESGQTLIDFHRKAKRQEDDILEIFKEFKKLSPSHCLMKYQQRTGKNPPLTSIRRAITNLTDDGKLAMTNEKMKGSYKRDEHIWIVL